LLCRLYLTYETSDIDKFYENDDSVLDMYSENPAGVDPYNYSITATQRCGNYSNEGDCYNRDTLYHNLYLIQLHQWFQMLISLLQLMGK
jgi:hypothetical protein